MAPRDPHMLVEELFTAANYEIGKEVGSAPGTLVRTARASEGLVRPKIVWKILERWPEALDRAFEDLGALRAATSADRTIGLFDGDPPAGQSGAVKQGATEVMTIRRLAFELDRIQEHLTDIQSRFEAEIGDRFLPRTVELEGGRRADAVESVVEWSQTASADGLLWIVADHYSGRQTVILAAASRIAHRFGSAPDQTRPVIYRHWTSTDGHWLLLREGWAVEAVPAGGAYFGYSTILKAGDPSDPFPEVPSKLVPRSTTVRLLAPTLPDVLAWLSRRAPERAAVMSRVASTIPEFGALICHPHGLERWADLVEARWPEETPSDVELVARLLVAALHDLPPFREEDEILRWAFEDLALGTCTVANEFEWTPDLSAANRRLEETLLYPLVRDHHFTNTLLRDYLVAQLILAKLRAGNHDILLRHHFPREFVLLFLAILSPEAAALVGEERSRTMQAEIAAEVEREVQLALAHNLKHPVALIRGALRDARRKLPPAERERIEVELSQIEDAARHVVALVDKTNQWSRVPVEPIEATSLSLALTRALAPLQRDAPHVQCRIDVADDVRVQASDEILQVILSNVLENAFHAVDQNGPERSVLVRARRTGETIRVEMTDSGPGVHAADRDRIFEPRVTTKKGGAGRPRGTGMGLPIARKYALHIGGRLWLDAEAAKTTFVLELVPAQEMSR